MNTDNKKLFILFCLAFISVIDSQDTPKEVTEFEAEFDKLTEEQKKDLTPFAEDFYNRPEEELKALAKDFIDDYDVIFDYVDDEEKAIAFNECTGDLYDAGFWM